MGRRDTVVPPCVSRMAFEPQLARRCCKVLAARASKLGFLHNQGHIASVSGITRASHTAL